MYMKSKQIKLIPLLFALSIFVALPHARGADEGDLLPNPVMDTPSTDPSPQAAIPDPTQNNSVSTTPEEDLPPPSNGMPSEDARLQVNKPIQSDEVFLPAPAAQDNITYTPMGNPIVPNSVYDTTFNPVRSKSRPPFSLILGYGSHTYASNLVQQGVHGFELGAEYRTWSLADTLYLSLYGSVTWLSLGAVGTYTDVKDTTLHAGPELQLDLGRRFTLTGSLLYRRNSISATSGAGVAQLDTLHETGQFQFGLGAQYDFYKVPHACVGVRGYVEKDYGALLLTLSLEPIPNRKPDLEDEAM